MPLQIIRGKKSGAVRTVIYGVEGIGKSTLAAQVPESLTIDVEDGAGQIDTARVVALDWRAIEYATKELIADPQGFRAVIYDTADWLEKALIDHMLKQSGKKSIEDYGYGKGYTILQEHVVRFLSLIDQLIEKGIHVIFVAHATCKRTSPPDQTDGFDRYELKLTKQVAPLLKEWADIVLFCNYRIQIVEGTDGRLKAQGGKERVMYATHTAAWDAKNRYGLPDEMPMEFAQLARVFAAAEPRTVTPAQATVAATNAAVVADPTPEPATPEQVAKLVAFAKTAEGAPIIEAALEHLHAVDLGEITTSEAAEIISSIPTQGAAKIPSHIAKWLDANAEAVTAYINRVKWITVGQTWRNLPEDRIHLIVDKVEKFARAAGIPSPGERKAA
jgi:hypothetical protein